MNREPSLKLTSFVRSAWTLVVAKTIIIRPVYILHLLTYFQKATKEREKKRVELIVRARVSHPPKAQARPIIFVQPAELHLLCTQRALALYPTIEPINAKIRRFPGAAKQPGLSPLQRVAKLNSTDQPSDGLYIYKAMKKILESSWRRVYTYIVDSSILSPLSPAYVRSKN